MIADKDEIREYYEKTEMATFTSFELNLNICSSYCLSLFSVINQFAVVNILAEYSNPTPRRMNKVTRRVLALQISADYKIHHCAAHSLHLGRVVRI